MNIVPSFGILINRAHQLFHNILGHSFVQCPTMLQLQHLFSSGDKNSFFARASLRFFSSLIIPIKTCPSFTDQSGKGKYFFDSMIYT